MSARIGTCPHCAKQMQPTLMEKNIIRRNRYECTKCFKKMVECLSWCCHTYVVLGFKNRYCTFCSNTDSDLDSYDYTDYPSSNRNIESTAKLGSYYAASTATAKATEIRCCTTDDNTDSDSCDVNDDSGSTDCGGDSGGDD